MRDKIFEQELFEAFSTLRHMRPGDDLIPRGVTSSEMQALLKIRFLRNHTGSARPSAVASALHITKSAFSQTLKSLEEKGFVERVRSNEDSRAAELIITSSGQLVFDEACAIREKHITGLLEYVGREDLEHCLRILDKIIEYQYQSGFEAGLAKDGDCGCA